MAAATRQTTARRLWAVYARPLLPALLASTVCLTVNSAIEPLMMWFLKGFLDDFELGQQSLSRLQEVVQIMVVLGSVLAVSDFGYLFLTDYVGQAMVRAVRRDLFCRMQRLSLSFFDDQATGQLMSRATNDISVLQNRLNFELARLIKCPLTILGLVVFILWNSWRLFLVSLVVIAVLVPLLGTFSRLMKRHTAQLQDRLGDLSARLQESLAAIRVVQCFGATDYEIQRFEEENAAVRRATMRTVRVRALLQPLTHLIGLFGILVVVWIGGREVFVKQTVTTGSLVTLVGSLQLITTNFKQLGRARLALAECLAACDKVFEVIDTETTIVNRPDALDLGAAEGRVTFDEVAFRYASGREVLHDVSLELLPGEAVAVVGPSGAGKSTLANLIPRLYDVTAGRVLVDGHDVRDLTLESLRSQIGIVPQETVLFRGTIRENIAYGKPAASLDEIRAAAVAANATASSASSPTATTPGSASGARPSAAARRSAWPSLGRSSVTRGS